MNSTLLRPAFFLENEKIPTVDFSSPQLGNPGCGGTEYLFVATPYYLKRLHSSQCSPIILANKTQSLPSTLETHEVPNVIAAAIKAKSLGADVFVYRPRRNEEAGLLNTITECRLNTLAWAHIPPKPSYMRSLALCEYVRGLICVENEQYDQAQDTSLAALKKLALIRNGFDITHFKPSNTSLKDHKLVVYMGALVPQKGFHELARAWPSVISRHPDASLKVIGTGRLYNEKAKLGPLGIAEESYELEGIVPYLCDQYHNVHSSVEFLGKLGHEKKSLLSKALIGVVNPTGISENCPGSALEFQASKTPVVSGAYWGMLDTVQHNRTGLLGKSTQDLASNICRLLDEPSRAIELGRNGPTFVEHRYNWDTITNEWIIAFQKARSSSSFKRIPFKRNLTAHHKWIILINRYLQASLGRLVPWPTVSEIKQIIIKKIK